jgi:hypothetical protein
MGLLGLFLNKSLLKLILIVAVILGALRITVWFVSLAAGLSPVAMTALLGITICIITSLTIRFDRLRRLSGLMRLLCLTVVPSILVFGLEVSISVSAPLNFLLEPATLLAVFVAYFAYRKGLFPFGGNSSFQIRTRLLGRLSKDRLLPKGIEEGHVAYNAGRKGFKVLKFIEVKHQLNPEDGYAITETTREQIAKRLVKRLTSMRRFDIETSYELYCHGGIAKIFIASVGEGRNYQKCRERVDECSRLLIESLRSTTPGRITARSLENYDLAKRALMMPLVTDFDDIQQIESDGYNAELYRKADSERPAKLRLIHLSNLQSLALKREISLFDIFLDVALTHRPRLDFVCILHAKPLPVEALDRDSMETSEAHTHALMQISEGLRDRFLDAEKEDEKSAEKRGERILDARQKAQETSLNFKRLKEADKSGYFQVSLTVVAEPATAESIAKSVKVRASQATSSAELSIDRVPPRALVGTIRRDLVLPSGKLTGEELASFIQLPRDFLGQRVKIVAEASMKPPTIPLTAEITPQKT